MRVLEAAVGILTISQLALGGLIYQQLQQQPPHKPATNIMCEDALKRRQEASIARMAIHPVAGGPVLSRAVHGKLYEEADRQYDWAESDVFKYCNR